MNKPVLYLSVTATLGLLLVLGVLQQRGENMPAAGTTELATAEYGERLIRHTAREMGSGQADPAQQFSGNNLDCSSCHLESGRQPGMLTLLTAAAKYPTFSGRDGIVGDLADRINGCMQRSMDGRPLATDSVQMQAMVTYIEQLGREYLAMGESSRLPDEPGAFVEPQRAANVENGAVVYTERCQICHGSTGEGLKETGDLADGYVFPPLWGPDSYNIGAGMARVLTAARFIKARMPLGSATLSDDEAFDVAAFMNAQPRPGMDNLERDYPERQRKPIDSPYPPYADPFPVEQHQRGPFGPIREYYEQQQSP